MTILDHLDKLRIFIAVAERGSISSASQELALSQPAITRAIQTLEHAVGYRLFTRNRNGMKLTEGGQLLFQTSGRLLKEITDATLRGAQARQEMVGTFTIGTYESLAEYLWPDFLLKVQKDFPLLKLSLRTDSKRSHLEELKNGTLDLLVDAEPRNHDGLTLWPLYSDRFGFFSKKPDDLTIESARQETLLFVRNAFDEDDLTLQEHIRNAGYIFQQEYTFDSFTTAKRMAEKGLGVAILPRRLGERESRLSLIKAKGFKESFGIHKIYATVSPHRENDARIKTLVNLLRKQLS